MLKKWNVPFPCDAKTPLNKWDVKKHKEKENFSSWMKKNNNISYLWDS